MCDPGCVSIVDQDMIQLDNYYNYKERKKIYGVTYDIFYNDFDYCRSRYQIAKKGEPFEDGAIRIQKKLRLKISQSSLTIKAVLDGKNGVVLTWKEMFEKEKDESEKKQEADQLLERWRNSVQKARELTTSMWLGLMP